MTLDGLQELGGTLWRNRVRTVLTALSVAWGIFMLVLLLGFGRGLENQVTWMFRDDAVNSIWLYRGKTSKAFEGYSVGRGVAFTNRDHDALEHEVPGVDKITSRFYGPSGTVKFGEETGKFDVRSTHPDHRFLENTRVVAGRFLNQRDLDERRKVAVIGREVERQLFKGVDPIGTWIDVDQVLFQVVGVFEDDGGLGEMEMVYLPITTAQMAFRGGENVSQIMFTVGDLGAEETAVLTEDVRELMARRLHFDPTDMQAIRVRNNVERFQQIQRIFTMLNVFVWIVGLGTVTAGIVGVSNIMLVAVNERTVEFGLRKALGATPFSIVWMVVQEALLLTGISGYGGLLVGIALLDVVSRFVPENDYLREPDVDLGVAFAATALLVVAGCIAGLVPALRAASVNPIEALRDA